MRRDLRIVTTCPTSSGTPEDRNLQRVVDCARRSDDAGHHGLLVHSDHARLDPWVVAQVILAASRRLRPVVTVQPLYVHPYAAARKVRSLVTLFGRPADLVLVAGCSRSELIALDDRDSHDRRYRRLVEYGTIVSRLLSSSEPIVHEGDSYRLYKPLTLPPLPPEQRPNLFVAASSETGRSSATALAATGVVPLLPNTVVGAGDGVRVGIVARDDADEAMAIAARRFPDKPAQRLEHRLEMQWADSHWQQQLEAAIETAPAPWWVAPFGHRHTQNPYLVGDTRTVARSLLPAFEAGCEWLFLDTPTDAEDLEHAHRAVDRAWKRAASPLAEC